MFVVRPCRTAAFRASWHTSPTASACRSRLFGSSTAVAIESSISRLSTLQTLLSRHGAPGSQKCNLPDDLIPIQLEDAPELVSALAPSESQDELANLHPYLFPIAQSKASENHFVCAYRNPFVELDDKEHNKNTPWPLVETCLEGGMQVLALNSEHLMRRIVCECDYSQTQSDLIDLYNAGLGQGKLVSSSSSEAATATTTAATATALDTPYEPGAVEKLGYGVDRYVLLRVGPFADLYQQMAEQHISKGDEQSSLIAAETCNSKVPGFGSNFLYYARLLSKGLPNPRPEEARDAARMCLRLPLATLGLYPVEALAEVAALTGVVDGDNTDKDVALEKIKELYDTMKQVEREEDPQQGKTSEQSIIEEANDLLDGVILKGQKWSTVRNQVAEKLRDADLNEMAAFVNRYR